MTKHYGKKVQMAVALVWYVDGEEMVNLANNTTAETTIALLEDGIKIAQRLKLS
jgi:hypothetical protein